MARGEKILVTGATGFVGSHLARRLVETGYDVFIMWTCEILTKSPPMGEGSLRKKTSSEKLNILGEPRMDDMLNFNKMKPKNRSKL